MNEINKDCREEDIAAINNLLVFILLVPHRGQREGRFVILFILFYRTI